MYRFHVDKAVSLLVSPDEIGLDSVITSQGQAEKLVELEGYIFAKINGQFSEPTEFIQDIAGNGTHLFVLFNQVIHVYQLNDENLPVLINSIDTFTIPTLQYANAITVIDDYLLLTDGTPGYKQVALLLGTDDGGS